MTLKEGLDLVQGASVIIASVVALLGINAWRRESTGKRRMELAEEVLALFYQAKDVVGFVRSPFCLSGETSTRESTAHETPDQKRIRDAVYVIRRRYDDHGEMFSRIRALRYRFMAQFGAESMAPFGKLKSVLDELFVAANQWVMLSEVDERTFSSPESLQAHHASVEKHASILWGVKKDDPLALRLEEAIQDIERICRPHLGWKE